MWPSHERLRPGGPLGLLLLWLLLPAGCQTAEPPRPTAPFQLAGAAVAVDFVAAEEAFEIRDARTNRRTALVRGVRLVLGIDRTEHRLGFVRAQRIDDTLVLTCRRLANHAPAVVLHLEGPDTIRVELRDEVALQSLVHEVTLDYEVAGATPATRTWLPHSHATSDHVAGDGSFHTPLAFVRHGTRALAWIPDWHLLARDRRLPQALEIDRGSPLRVRHGLVAHRVASTPTGGFTRQGEAPVAVQGELLRFAHAVRLIPDAHPDSLGALLRELWDRSVPKTHPTGPDFDTAAAEFFPRAAARSWIDLSGRANAAGTFATGRAASTDGLAGADAWYEARQSSVRTALGLSAFARRTGDAGLAAKARQVLAHALSAPDRGGLSPSIFLVDEATRQSRWVLDSKTSGTPTCYDAMDVATTSYWMLRMIPASPGLRPNILNACRRAARFMRLNQLPSGAFPSYFEAKFLAPVSGPGTAETGSVTRFLIEYSVASGDIEALVAARRAISWMTRQADIGAWLDFETAAAQGPNVDRRSGMPRQGTLGLIHCALAALRLREIEDTPALTSLCTRLLSHIARYQQIFVPPWLDVQFGGMGAGNFDHRWDDARQSLAALAFFTAYRVLDDPHWLERGVAALRAGLTTGAREFQPARDEPGPTSTPHWGLGSACTVAEIVRQDLGQGVLDVRRGTAHGIDAIWFEDLEVDLIRGQVHFRLRTHVADLREVVLAVRNLDEGRESLTLHVNGEALGSFDARQLAAGITARPVYVPRVEFTPPRIIHRHLPWSPYARALSDPAPASAVLEYRLADGRTRSVPLQLDAQSRLLVPHQAITLPREEAAGSIASRVVFFAGGRTYAAPQSGFATTVLGDFDRIDIGDRHERALLRGAGTRVRWFANGREFGRHLPPGTRATYRIPVPTSATHFTFTVRLAGTATIRVGELPLHEDTTQVADIRELTFELADHRLWSAGSLDLTFAAAPIGAVDIARIRYQTRGQVTSTIGLGETRIGREPDQALRILVQPVALLDRPLGTDQESLRLAFFGGPDYRMTPPPNSQRTLGSVASYLESLSGGVTTLSGRVLEEAKSDQVAADLTAPDSPIDPRLVRGWTAGTPVDVVVVVLGQGPVPPARRVRIGSRTVPVTFLSAVGPEGGFLSCGAAATAVLRACYGIQPLDSPRWGNFGNLALSGARVNHAPAAPSAFNLVKTGWADHLVVARRTIQGMNVSPLLPGRVGYVLDCAHVPGRGRLFLEMRHGPSAEPGLAATGALLYWQFDAASRPHIGDLGRRTSRPEILRVSPRLGRIGVPQQSGDTQDLFQQPTARLPTGTLTGERIWELAHFRPLEDGRASVDLRYLCTDLLRSPQARWLNDADELAALAGRIERTNGRVELTLQPGERLRLVGSPVVGLRRVFCEVRGTRGRVRASLGAGDRRATMEFSPPTGAGWLRTDLGTGAAVELTLTNPDAEQPATLALGQLLSVPRAPPLHQVQPVQLPTTPSVHLSDGVVYDLAKTLGKSQHKTVRTTVPVVLRPGPTGLRIRCGLARNDRNAATLSLHIRNADGSKRTTLLDAARIGDGTGEGELFLGLFELPPVEADAVRFLELEWRGTTDLHVIDLAVIRS